MILKGVLKIKPEILLYIEGINKVFYCMILYSKCRFIYYELLVLLNYGPYFMYPNLRQMSKRFALFEILILAKPRSLYVATVFSLRL